MPAKKEEKPVEEEPKAEDADKAKKEEEKKAKPELTPLEKNVKAIEENLELLAKAVEERDQQFFGRIVRATNSIRKGLSAESIAAIAKKHAPLFEARIAPFVDVEMDKGDKEEEPAKAKDEAGEEEKKEEEKKEPTTELNCYMLYLLTLFFVDAGNKDKAAELAKEMVTLVQTHNLRTLDAFSAQAYYFYSLTNEHLDRLPSIRDELLSLQRTACLRHNEPGQAALTNALLRNYLHSNLYAQADNFRRLSKAFPETRATYAQHARYFYYTAKIFSMQLKYENAYQNLNLALRKAPQNAAIGFRQAATKLLIIVQLLMGEIPERSVFKQDQLRRSLLPYFQLTKAVRVGDVNAFSETVARHKVRFEADGVISLIIRLRHNVIKTGLRKINLSYSRISMADICSKLKLDNEDDGEHIAAKAIADNVISASIDRKDRCLISRENVDVYSTHQPTIEFDRQIRFCMGIHNDAVKALRFPPNAHKSQSELAEEEARRKKLWEEAQTKEEDKKDKKGGDKKEKNDKKDDKKDKKKD